MAVEGKSPVAEPAVMRRPASASKTSGKSCAKSGVVPKVKSTARKASTVSAVQVRYEKLLAKPTKVARPCQSEKPTAHSGGKIYYSKADSCYRVKLRTKDRCDVKVRAHFDDRKAMRVKFQVCCAMIEYDERPVHA